MLATLLDRSALSMADSAARLRLHYQHTPAALETTRLAVLQFLAPHALPPRVVYGVELVLEEWLTNVVRHGHDIADQARVDIELSVLPTAVILEFQDQGRAFEPGKAPQPAPAASLDEARPGGLGLAMIRHVASSLRHERRASRNVFTVTVPRR
ncbi:ATP-binding protein [Aquabacterium sp.]|uniref:ATP-binding protein n=1 Tax=Aquabacterium sp. TaxID=1872578 RepID=UPI002B96FE94|nr:ATP-binding protein [Aquabacterium sp.]HSW04099.1 ATP-binding protein [Aquabacterium sp.]